LKIIPRTALVYSFSPKNKPVEKVVPGELVLFKTIDALGGQVKDESFTLDKIDWSRVNGATGPIYVEDAEPGDTLIVEILDIKIHDKGVLVVVPKYGALGHINFNPKVKLVNIREGIVYFDNLHIKANPMIGTIGVSPAEEEIPTGSLGRHGGNMDSKDVSSGTKLYLPVFVKGALLAIGDLHAVQADGELCVSAVEVSGEVLVRIGLIKGKQPKWPILETKDYYAILTCGDTLDEACRDASEVAVKAISSARNIPFEEAYMIASLVVDLKINQVVDPKKGVRAIIPKGIIRSIEHLLL